MKSLPFLVLVACAFARQATAAPVADLTLRRALEVEARGWLGASSRKGNQFENWQDKNQMAR